MSIKYKVTSHETFTHDSIDSLGYDWERIANPQIGAKYPRKIYLPQTIQDIVEIVKETESLGQKLTIRSKGHSSNDLVLAEGGNILCTEKLNHILGINDVDMTVKVEAGVVLAELDQYLSTKGYGLPIIGDHNHITAGGFASVGGISPASHRFGMFIDNVQQIDFVDWEGTLLTCDRTTNREEFYRALAGTGQCGVIATLTCKVIRIDKRRTVLKNNRFITLDVDQFITHSHRSITNPGDALMERGLWLDFPLFGRTLTIGQFSSYMQTRQSALTALRNKFAYGYLHFLGYWAGRLPRGIDLLVHYLGILGIVLSPKYASTKNIESFTDKVLDETVGDPTRMLIALAPIEEYPKLFPKLYRLFLEFRAHYACFTFLAFYVKAIHSEYLSHGDPNKHFCELMAYVGINPKRMTDDVLNDLISQMDDTCIEHGAYRYMHSKTVKDLKRRRQIDPNAYYYNGSTKYSHTDFVESA